MPPAPLFPVREIPDVVFGHALRRDGPVPEPMALEMDLFLPDAPVPPGGRPAVMLAFGGAFHRGDRRDDAFADDRGRTSTAMAEYCRRLAARGFAAASVGYRLAQLRPEAGPTQAMAPGAANLDRIQVVRAMLGLPPTTPEEMHAAIEGAIDDVTAAYRFLAGAARRYGIDPSRIVMGGFSAGARLAISAALTHDVDPAGVVCLSPAAPEGFAQAHRAAGGARFPALLVVSDDDLPAIRESAPRLQGALVEAGFDARRVLVPGHGHFYPAEARIEGGETGVLWDEILAFLDRAVGLPAAPEAARGTA